MFAGVAELVDVLDLGSSAARRGGSTPFTRTELTFAFVKVFLFYIVYNNINKCIFAPLLNKYKKDEDYSK